MVTEPHNGKISTVQQIRICEDDKMVNITDVRQILQFAIDAEIKVFLDERLGNVIETSFKIFISFSPLVFYGDGIGLFYVHYFAYACSIEDLICLL